jgi:hypothetical protein
MFALVMALVAASVQAQPVAGTWGGYTYFPRADFAGGDAPPAGVEVQVSSWQTGAAFPLSFSGGATLLLNSVAYEVTNIDYSGPTAGMTLVERVHAVSYTLFLIQKLSDKWQLVAVATPGLASELEGDLSTDDVSFTGVLGARHAFSERFALGGGLAYERSFGEPLPLPFLLVEWAIGPKLALNALLPMNATLFYSPWKTLDVGIFGEVGGNLFHGDPDKYGVGTPLLNYSVASAGAETRLHVAPWAHVTLKAGYTFLRRFEFSDGADVAQSYDLKQSWYVEGGLRFGM